MFTYLKSLMPQLRPSESGDGLIFELIRRALFRHVAVIVFPKSVILGACCHLRVHLNHFGIVSWGYVEAILAPSWGFFG